MKTYHRIATLAGLVGIWISSASTTHAVYHPSQGRWFNRDPIEERAGPNLSLFVGNQPVDSVDREGLAMQGLLAGVLQPVLRPPDRPVTRHTVPLCIVVATCWVTDVTEINAGGPDECCENGYVTFQCSHRCEVQAQVGCDEPLDEVGLETFSGPFCKPATQNCQNPRPFVFVRIGSWAWPTFPVLD